MRGGRMTHTYPRENARVAALTSEISFESLLELKFIMDNRQDRNTDFIIIF